jgi:hypothetical protein
MDWYANDGGFIRQVQHVWMLSHQTAELDGKMCPATILDRIDDGVDAGGATNCPARRYAHEQKVVGGNVSLNQHFQGRPEGGGELPGERFIADTRQQCLGGSEVRAAEQAMPGVDYL